MVKKKETELIDDETLLENDEIIEDDYVDDEDFSEEEGEELEEADLDTKDNGTEAAATLRPGSTKSDMMKSIMNAMSGMSGGDMIKFFELAMGAAQEFPAKIPDGTAEKNASSIKAKASPVKEDLEAIFGDNEELSEEFKDKISTLFEAAVSTRLSVEIARIEEEFGQRLEEQVEQVTNSLVENVDKYLDYVAEQWLEENVVAIDASLKTELAENFINELGDLCRKYNMDLPEGQDDVIEDLVNKVDELSEALNDSESRNIEMNEEIQSLRKLNKIEEVANSLSPVHYSKFKALAENVEFVDDESFEKKLSYIKEGFFSDKAKTKSTKLINEEIGEDAEDSEEPITFTDPAVRSIHNAISRTVKR